MGYLVISRCEDDPDLFWYETKEALMRHIADELQSNLGQSYVFIEDPKQIPALYMWPSKTLLVVKGDLVVPKPREIVKEWDVE